MLRVRDVAFVVNIGDSKTVVLENNRLLLSTIDHHAVSEPEKEHIESAGGIVEFGYMQGELEISRAFGDCQFKSVAGSQVYDGVNGIMRVVPDIHIVVMQPSADYVFYSATDGIFSEQGIPVEEVVKTLLSNKRNTVCAQLTEKAFRNGFGSRDDISGILETVP